ncbi:MAG: TetR/AcrR family transcriptional regulator [Desulfobacterales bacterium]|nr:TetR/AcrR family transcriptional regulator [Desulfobacterales bacterium]
MKPKESIDTIHLAALRVFSQYGFKKTTLDDIAAELGMTKGNLYLYSKNKRDLYENTVRSAMLRWQTRVGEAIAAETDARSRFSVMCRKAVDYLSEDDDLRRLLIRDPDIFPMFPENDPYADINGASVGMIRQILEQGMAEKTFREIDMETVPEIIFSVYKMIIIRMYILTGDPSLQKRFDQTIELITQGLFVQSA